MHEYAETPKLADIDKDAETERLTDMHQICRNQESS
jgi:hypothetical protein